MGFGGLQGSGHGVTPPKFATGDELTAAVESRVAAQELCGVSATSASAPLDVSNAGRWVNTVAAVGTDG